MAIIYECPKQKISEHDYLHTPMTDLAQFS